MTLSDKQDQAWSYCKAIGLDPDEVVCRFVWDAQRRQRIRVGKRRWEWMLGAGPELALMAGELSPLQRRMFGGGA